MTSHSHAEEHKHPNYFVVFIALAVITAVMTAVEVADLQTRMGLSRSAINFFYLVLSLIKATLVAMYYMHLKLHSRLYTAIFCAPILLVMVLVVVLLSRSGVV